MRNCRRLLVLTLTLLFAVTALAQAQNVPRRGGGSGSGDSARRSITLGPPSFRPFAWEPGTELKYAIFDGSGTRLGTAYYRVKEAPDEFGSGLWELRYMARGENIRESSVVIFNPNQLVPVKTTRKLVRDGQTTIWVMEYNDNGIQVTKEVEGESDSQTISHSGPVYDYEQLMFLFPLVQEEAGTRHYIPLYHAGDAGLMMCYWAEQDTEMVTLGDRAWEATRYRISLGSVTQHIWLAEVNGKTQVVKYDSGVGAVFQALNIPSNTDAEPSPGEVSSPGGADDFPEISVERPESGETETYEVGPEGEVRQTESSDAQDQDQNETSGQQSSADSQPGSTRDAQTGSEQTPSNTRDRPAGPLPVLIRGPIGQQSEGQSQQGSDGDQADSSDSSAVTWGSGSEDDSGETQNPDE